MINDINHIFDAIYRMAAPLSDGAIEYSDGTQATLSQMAKDVVTFLSWAAQPEHDKRKKMSIDVNLSQL